ncbi:MAG: hypothetical protein EBT80_09270, partial [Chitinophagales bacterium]|nr:hypothetical protein [Chitinophagales bacterium]
MKSLGVFLFLYVLVPGSGQLIWDGLPLNTRAEFAGLIALLIAITNRTVRESFRKWLDRRRWFGAVKPALILLSLLKLLTFAWHPFSDGFEACYRSIYEPLSNPEACEKSYDGPFLRRSNLGNHNTSRIESAVDFGLHKHDWSLPFMNEYPRMGTAWLERFPFTASYGATIRNESADRRFIPIFGNGEIQGKVGATEFTTAYVPLSDRYEFPRMTFAEVPAGVSEFTLNYRFSDDDLTNPPDAAPPIRGPYAMLKVGQIQSRNSILEFAKVRIRGWSLNLEDKQTPDFIYASDRFGTELGRSEPQQRPDVAEYVGLPDLTANGFNFAIPASTLTRGEVSIFAAYGDRRVRIGELSQSPDFLPALPQIEIQPSPGQRSDMTAWFDADRNDIEVLAPSDRLEKPLVLHLLLLLLDFASALIFIVMFFIAVRVLSRTLLAAAGLAALTFFLFHVGMTFLPRPSNSPLVFAVLGTSLLCIAVYRYVPRVSLLVYLPAAVVISAYKSFDQLERFHSSRGERWWGRLLFYWRDSDWFATQGYARTVFLEGSLRGGEGLFWFQAGPRYLALVSRVLLGENDVLIGIITCALGFFAVFVLAARFMARGTDTSTVLVGAGALFVMLNFMSDDLIAGFGFVGSSEFPTWILLLLVASFVISRSTEMRAWPMVAFSVALGYSIQLRPNQIGGAVLLFIMMLLLVDRSDTARAIGTMSKMIVSFVALVMFSLWHNLYYGESFVPFTGNAGINYAFSWLDVMGLREGPDTVESVWNQLRFMMYWNAPGNLSWASLFWGAQLLWIVALAYRYKKGLLFRA